MSRLIKASRRAFLSLSSPKFHLNHFQSPQISTSLIQSRNYISEMRKSTFEGHILRVLRNEIQYETEYAPPKQPVTEFGLFRVDDCPGEQFIRLKSKDDGKNEEITIEVTMFDGAIPTKTANGSDDTTLHISLVVNVVKGEDGETFQFVCSAWPDCMEVQKICFVRPNGPGNVYMGPDFKDLDDELQKSLMEFLEERGVDDDLAAFLHEYMHNKDRIELIRWMGKVKSFVEK
ncbi:hypothetical protein ACHQM5_029833 [Ranunculus cassubicifolius]